MALRPIIRLDNPVLRKKAIKVTAFDAPFQRLVDDMVETMLAAPGVGLAAPQVAVSQRVIVVRLQDDEDSREEFGEEAGRLYVVANPKIIKVSRKTVSGVEACLSLPGWFGEVDRREEIVLTGLDREGRPLRLKAKDWLARVFQHEIDHLDGIMYIDIATDVWEAGQSRSTVSQDEDADDAPSEPEILT